MTKRKRTRPQRPPAQWSTSDIIALLAWLDHTIKHKELDFESTIISRLDQVYTLPQVNNKLFKLWDKHGRERKPGYPPSTWRDIFTYGSRCLDGPNWLPEDIQEGIAKSTKKLEDAYRKRDVQLARRRLRSSSTQIEFPLLVQTASPKINSNTSRKQRSSAPIKSLTPSVVKREAEQTESPVERDSAAKKRRRQLPKKPIAVHPTTKHRKPVNEKCRISAPSHIRHSSPVVDDSDEELSDILSKNVEEDVEQCEEVGKVQCICGATKEEQIPEGLMEENIRWIECTGCNFWQHIFCVNYLCERCDPKAHKDKYDSRLSSQTAGEASARSIEDTSNNVSVEPAACEELSRSTLRSSVLTGNSLPGTDMRLESARDKIKDLEEELREAKGDIRDRDESMVSLEREVFSLRAAQKKRDERSEFPIEELIERNLNLEKRLLGDLKVREEGSKFTTLTGMSREWFGTTKMDEGFCDVYGQSRQVLCRHNETVPFIPSSLTEHGDLRKLVSKCFAISNGVSKELQGTMSKLSRFSPEAIVRALITCALAEWVFETDFPKFDNGSSEVLAKYRELLVKQDSAITLRNLDLASRAALVKSVNFREQKIPETAKGLTIRLSQALAPLFSDTPEDAAELDWDGFATWRDNKEEWMDRRNRFIQMFKFALETKADSSLNIQDYEMLIYPPGTIFNKKTMEVETRAGVKDTAGNHEGRTVELCIEAAVFAHERKQLSEDSSIAEVVTSKNFVARVEKDRAKIEPAVKAVVVLSDEQLIVEN